MKTLQERINLLEQAGVDTSAYELKLNGIVLKSDDNVVNEIVGNQQLTNKKLFRRWITGQTFRMLNSQTFNQNNKRWEIGWDAYLRNRYDYMYQFKMMLEEIRILAKLEIKDKDEFMERIKFFNRYVVIDTCNHYINQLFKYTDKNQNHKHIVKLAKYGEVFIYDLNKLFVDDLREIINDITESETYSEIYVFLKKFIKKMNKLPADTPKCPSWKTAFKGSGAYYSLRNIILFHNVILENCKDKKESLRELKVYTSKLHYTEVWKLHYLLKDTIAHNNFDLARSINKNK